MSRLRRASILLGLALCSIANRALAQPASERLMLTTSDGQQIFAFWYAKDMPRQSPVALLLHNPGATHAHWLPILEPLQRAGFRILAIDFRGHGDSKATTTEAYEAMRQRDPKPYRDMIHDVEAAVLWLVREQKLAPEHIGLIGGEFAANLALEAMARNRTLGAVVAMSPSKNYYSFPLEATTKKIGRKPILVMVPKQILNDGASQIQAQQSGNPAFELKIYPKYEFHGVHTLGLSWRVEETIAKWMKKVFGLDA